MDSNKVMENMEKKVISEGQTALGIEFGSTRIKAVLIDQNTYYPIASGDCEWENQWKDGIWTYSLEDIWLGLQKSYQALREDVKKKYQTELSVIGAIGISGMQHGYLPFDQEGKLLVPFRTWRNTITGEASKKLTELFHYPIPQRWSIAHLYQAVLNQEEHLKQLGYMTTLAGYVHWKLTGEKIVGLNEASGMFPIDLCTRQYDEIMGKQFQSLVDREGFPWKIQKILPKILPAGQEGGRLTKEGAALLDPSGNLKAGIPFCPPEGDGATGMVATNSIQKRRGHISAGTSAFGMIVLEHELKRVHPEIDLVVTPEGNLVGMAHCNNCTSDLNAWVKILGEFSSILGIKVERGVLYDLLYHKALEGAPDCGGLLAYNYYSGEHITGFEEGCPLLIHPAESKFDLANFMRAHLYTSLGALKQGMDILLNEEAIQVDEVIGHGGLFKTEGVGQKILADALKVPVVVMETAGEGGPWGMALLAAYMVNSKKEQTLSQFLSDSVFQQAKKIRTEPEPEGVKGYESFMERYRAGLVIERAAIEALSNL